MSQAQTCLLYLTKLDKRGAELADVAQREAQAFVLLFGSGVRRDLAIGDRVGRYS
jgi:hypothetical protein